MTVTASTSNARWLTAEDLAAELRIPKQTIYKWRVEGFGPTAHKIGRHLRFSREDVDDWYSTLQEDDDF
ncbi:MULTISPECIES: helix-turn-helix domain-containing protein [unclassified Brevibacterium]|uniref:helix-turn-helix domain-containing protein n=1 Tax=unclassified Brevibacterium TaxID=2614124 RepID=UPI001F0D15A4|nr:helix-turn-helix domain-containing protein [Brevibacterium sp. S22]